MGDYNINICFTFKWYHIYVLLLSITHKNLFMRICYPLPEYSLVELTHFERCESEFHYH